MFKLLAFSNLNVDRLHESPVEVERKKRQLEKKKSEEESRQKRAIDEEGDIDVLDENQRNRRQTTDPDQLCPTVASFVMPRAGVNAKGISGISKLCSSM